MHLDPKSDKVIHISLREKVPPVEEEAAEVDSLLDWGRGAPQPIADNKWIKHIRLQSELLTRFWGRPTYLGAVVLLPDGLTSIPTRISP